MFERFTTQARQVVQAGLTEARAVGAKRIGADHLLIAMAATRSGAARDALMAAGLDAPRLRVLAAPGPAGRPETGRPETGQENAGRVDTRQLDPDALATLGIDLDQVRRAAEAAFGPGALDRPAGVGHATAARLTSEAKGALGRALRLAQARGDRVITAAHLLGGLIDQGDNAALRLLAAAGADPAALRADLLRRLTPAA